MHCVSHWHDFHLIHKYLVANCHLVMEKWAGLDLEMKSIYLLGTITCQYRKCGLFLKKMKVMSTLLYMLLYIFRSVNKHFSSCFKACPICLTNRKDMAFGCGHLVSICTRLELNCFKIISEQWFHFYKLNYLVVQEDCEICPKTELRPCHPVLDNLILYENLQTCRDCGATLSLCPLCRKPITTRVRLYVWNCNLCKRLCWFKIQFILWFEASAAAFCV